MAVPQPPIHNLPKEASDIIFAEILKTGHYEILSASKRLADKGLDALYQTHSINFMSDPQKGQPCFPPSLDGHRFPSLENPTQYIDLKVKKANIKFIVAANNPDWNLHGNDAPTLDPSVRRLTCDITLVHVSAGIFNMNEGFLTFMRSLRGFKHVILRLQCQQTGLSHQLFIEECTNRVEKVRFYEASLQEMLGPAQLFKPGMEPNAWFLIWTPVKYNKDKAREEKDQSSKDYVFEALHGLKLSMD